MTDTHTLSKLLHTHTCTHTRTHTQVVSGQDHSTHTHTVTVSTLLRPCSSVVLRTDGSVWTCISTRARVNSFTSAEGLTAVSGKELRNQFSHDDVYVDTHSDTRLECIWHWLTFWCSSSSPTCSCLGLFLVYFGRNFCSPTCSDNKTGFKARKMSSRGRSVI